MREVPPSRPRRARLRRLLLPGAGVILAICLLVGVAGAGASTGATGKGHRAHKTPRSHRARARQCLRTHRGHRGRRVRCRSTSHRTSAHKPIARVATTTTNHIETWAYDDGCNGGAGATSALIRRWVTFAESNCGLTATKATSDCHAGTTIYCDVMHYLDTNWSYPHDAVPVAGAAAANWWMHEPAPHQSARIFSPGLGGAYMLDQANPAVRSYFRSFALSHFNSDDGLLMDWQTPGLKQELYYSSCGCSATSEITSDQALRTAHEQTTAALVHRNGTPFIEADNTLPPNPYLPQGLDMLNHATGMDGWTVEGEPESAGIMDPFYSTLLDQIAYVSTHTQGFVAPMSRAPAGASYQAQSRRVQEATMLLGFSPGHIVDWADLEQGSGRLAVWPEEAIYPTVPAQSMASPGGAGCLAGTGAVCSTGGHNSLQVAPGLYRREFRACTRFQVSFGGCAAIINTTASPVTVRSSWLTGHYGHQITFVGGDVVSGGSLNLAGAPFTANATVLSPHDAILLSS